MDKFIKTGYFKTISKHVEDDGNEEGVGPSSDVPKLDKTSECTNVKTITDIGVDNPRQPLLQNYPNTTFGKRKRSFQKHWFASAPWLEYSVELDACFCFPCRKFGTDSGYAESSFRKIGIRNWKKPCEKIKENEERPII